MLHSIENLAFVEEGTKLLSDQPAVQLYEPKYEKWQTHPEP